MDRARSVILMLVVIGAAPSLAASMAPAHPAMATLDAKADAPLARALADGMPALEVIVTGVPHALGAVPRAEAAAAMDAAATPFFALVRSVLMVEGGAMVDAWAAAPAVKVVAPPAALSRLAELPEARGLALDHGSALRVVDAGEGGAPSAENTGGRQMIQAEDVWALGYRGEGRRVSIVGTGIDPTHEAFRHADGSSRIVAWSDFSGGRSSPYDDHGQGTFIAATAAGSSAYVDPVHGAFQETGVAPAASILASKFLDATGGGSFQGALDAIQWSFEEGADATLNGWGAACTSSMLAVLQMLRATTDAGMVSVFTAGAGGPDPGTVSGPACSESVISVGGIAASMAVYPPSGRGPCSDIELPSPARLCPDLVAKAVNVRSAAPRGACPLCDPSGYRTLSTMSASAAFVAGAVLLGEQMKLAHTGVGWNTTLREEEEVLKLTSLDLGTPGPDDTYGWGLPQLANVHALLAQAPEPVLAATLDAPVPVLRDGGSGPLAFGVRNLGRATASGLFEVTLLRPDGTTEVIDSRPVSLGLLASAGVSRTFVASGAALPGAYVLRGAFAYSWTNETTGEVQSGNVSREAGFEVRRVLLQVETKGLEGDAPMLLPRHVLVTVRNVGNDDATRVVVRFTAPDHYVFANVDDLDATRPTSRYAAPAPDDVAEDRNFGRVTLSFEVGDLPAGEAWSFHTTLAATRPGPHRFLVVANYCDAAGICGSQGALIQQQAGLPRA